MMTKIHRYRRPSQCCRCPCSRLAAGRGCTAAAPFPALLPASQGGWDLAAEEAQGKAGLHLAPPGHPPRAEPFGESRLGQETAPTALDPCLLPKPWRREGLRLAQT